MKVKIIRILFVVLLFFTVCCEDDKEDLPRVRDTEPGMVISISKP